MSHVKIELKPKASVYITTSSINSNNNNEQSLLSPTAEYSSIYKVETIDGQLYLSRSIRNSIALPSLYPIDEYRFNVVHYDDDSKGDTSSSITTDASMDQSAIRKQIIVDYLQHFQRIKNKIVTLAVDIGIHSSIWMLGNHDTLIMNQVEQEYIADLDLMSSFIHHLCSSLSQKMTTSKDYLRVSWTMKIRCYEIFADQITDLLLINASDSSTASSSAAYGAASSTSSTNANTNKVKIKENPQTGHYISGLMELIMNSGDSNGSMAYVYKSLFHAFQRRLVLLREMTATTNTTNPSPNNTASMNSATTGSNNNNNNEHHKMLSSKTNNIVGHVSNMFIIFEVDQVLCPTLPLQVQQISNNNNTSVSLINRTSMVQFNLLADMDALTAKSSKLESFSIVPLQDALYVLNNKAANNNNSSSGGSCVNSYHRHINNKDTIQDSRTYINGLLSSSAKALLTLSRVVSAIYNNNNNNNNSPIGQDNNSPAIIDSKRIHIPFRESVVSRALQPVLEGRYYNHIHCCLHEQLENSGIGNATASHALRMTMELRGCLRGRLKSNDKRVLSYTKHDDKKQYNSSRLKKTYLPYDNSDQVDEKSHDDDGDGSGGNDSGSVGSSGVSNNFWELMRSLKENSSDAMDAYVQLEDLQALRDRMFQSIDGLEVIEDYTRNASNYNVTDEDGIVYSPGILRQDNNNDGLKKNEATVVSLRGDVQAGTASASSFRAASNDISSVHSGSSRSVSVINPPTTEDSVITAGINTTTCLLSENDASTSKGDSSSSILLEAIIGPLPVMHTTASSLSLNHKKLKPLSSPLGRSASDGRPDNLIDRGDDRPIALSGGSLTNSLSKRLPKIPASVKKITVSTTGAVTTITPNTTASVRRSTYRAAAAAAVAIVVPPSSNDTTTKLTVAAAVISNAPIAVGVGVSSRTKDSINVSMLRCGNDDGQMDRDSKGSCRGGSSSDARGDTRWGKRNYNEYSSRNFGSKGYKSGSVGSIDTTAISHITSETCATDADAAAVHHSIDAVDTLLPTRSTSEDNNNNSSMDSSTYSHSLSPSLKLFKHNDSDSTNARSNNSKLNRQRLVSSSLVGLPLLSGSAAVPVNDHQDVTDDDNDDDDDQVDDDQVDQSLLSEYLSIEGPTISLLKSSDQPLPRIQRNVVQLPSMASSCSSSSSSSSSSTPNSTIMSNGLFQRKDPYANGSTSTCSIGIMNDAKLALASSTQITRTRPIEASTHSTSSIIGPSRGSINYDYFCAVNQTKYDNSNSSNNNNNRSIVERSPKGSMNTNHKEGSHPIGNEDDDGGCTSLTELESKYLRAINLNNLEVVRYCINQGVNTNVKNSFGRDGMQIAARNGSLDVMMLLYDNGGDLTTSGKTGDTLFHLAAANGHVNVMIWMNSIGGLATCVNRYGQTPAHIAARRGEVDVLKYLHHELCVDVQQEDFDGQTPLQLVPRHSMYGNDQSVQEAREFLISLLDIDGKG